MIVKFINILDNIFIVKFFSFPTYLLLNIYCQIAEARTQLISMEICQCQFAVLWITGIFSLQIRQKNYFWHIDIAMYLLSVIIFTLPSQDLSIYQIFESKEHKIPSCSMFIINSINIFSLLVFQKDCFIISTLCVLCVLKKCHKVLVKFNKVFLWSYLKYLPPHLVGAFHHHHHQLPHDDHHHH